MTAVLPPNAVTDLETALEKYRVSSLLVVGDQEPLFKASPDAVTHWWKPDQQAPPLTEQQYDLAVVLPETFQASPALTIPALAALRDIHARISWLYFQAETAQPDWHINEFLALGFRQLKTYDSPASIHLLYYDIYDYKHTPDWFGPKNWANPEQWDKNRW